MPRMLGELTCGGGSSSLSKQQQKSLANATTVDAGTETSALLRTRCLDSILLRCDCHANMG
eukprot:1969744-Amphidinium_carterae.2